MAKPKGLRGSWFAKWEGESLPCVHKHWMERLHYKDAGMTDDPKWGPFVQAIRDGQKVILTDDKLDANGLPTGDRNNYIGLFRVENVEVRDNELHFDFVERLADF